MKFELLVLLKQRSIQLLLVLSTLVTCLSLLNGWENVQHMRAQIAHAQLEEQRQHTRQLSEFSSHGELNAGEIGYYFFHYVYHQPSEWSFVALGNRMVTPYVQRIRLLGLQGQLYDGESHHPEYVMLGAFDYAFWLVFCLPLLCIALMHDLRASESHAQRLVFLTSVVANPKFFWLRRLVVRWILLLLIFALPLIGFALWQELSSKGLWLVLGVTTLYSLFWTAISAMISLNSRATNANTNAMWLTSIWLMFCLVLPNLSQLWIHQRYPVLEGSQIALQHRQLVHNAWDLPKTVSLDPFYQLYPQWQHTPPVTGRFHWKWYYAFQHMADVKLAPLVKQREDSLRQRDQATANLSYLLPSLWVQRQLEEVAHSNITHLLQHRSRITQFHTALRHALYPYLFEEKAITPDNIKQLPKFD